MEQEAPADQLIRITSNRYARYERILDACRLPGLLLGAAVGVGLVAFGLAPLLGLAAQGIWMCGTLAAVAGGGVTFGYIDKYADRFGLRNLALGGMKTERHMVRVEKQWKDSLPLSGTATKAFIKAITEGIRDKLHIGKPLTLKRTPQVKP
ncbi:MAG: hypothetical protein ACAH83_09500 [Alphaproteobacteria bacterium]